jgi:predicted alpha-1,2-mannosidase
MRLQSVILLLAVAPALAQNDPVSQVDPFIGTQTSALLDNGNTVPGATRPFGMLYWSPDPADGGIYRYETPTTRGFSPMHLSGPGCGVFGDIPIFPMLGLPAQPPPVLPLSYQASFRHSDEVAQPGFYSVKLDSGIEVSIAAAVHSGIAKFEYPAEGNPHTLLLDLSRSLNQNFGAHIKIAGSQLTGSVTGGSFCGFKNRYTVYFSLRTDQAPQAAGTFDEVHMHPASEEASGPRVGGYLQFAPSTRTVSVKIGLSFVSAANAEQNLAAEIPGWDIDRVKQDARQSWSDVLAHADVSGGTASQRKVFYTAMYHAMLHPTVFSDMNGEYLGFDEEVHKATQRVQYANYSGWDIYRSQVQLITMFFPKIGSDIAQSLVADAEQGGLPIWPVANDESSCMVGDPSDLIIASIYAFGGREFDTRAALSAMLRGADDPSTHIRLYPERPGLAEFLNKGYISESPTMRGSASVTLEDENADYAIATFAKALGDPATFTRFLDRSSQWRKLFDPEMHYIRPRDSNGKFLANFKPENYEGFVEGNSAQYTWMIPYDLPALINAIGGNKVVNDRLDDYFSQYGSYQLNHGPYFYIANEPSFGNPWIYNWSGKPWRTQEVVRKTLNDLFSAAPGGLPGNDDLGATSSWIVFAQLGMYPEIPAVAGFTTNSPTFPEVHLTLGDNHRVQILAPGSSENLYIDSLSIDGRPVKDSWIDWSTMEHATKIEYQLTSKIPKPDGSHQVNLAPNTPAPR